MIVSVLRRLNKTISRVMVFSNEKPAAIARAGCAPSGAIRNDEYPVPYAGPAVNYILW